MNQCLQSYVVVYMLICHCSSESMFKYNNFPPKLHFAQTQHQQLDIERFQADQCPVTAKDTMLDHNAQEWDAHVE